jgi:hypothetical protein
MYRAFCIISSFLVILIWAPLPASADSGVTYTISGIYSTATTSSQLSDPSATFSMSFTVPSQPVTTTFLIGDSFYVDSAIPFSYSASNGGTASGQVYLSFYSLTSGSQPGGLFVDFCADGPSCLTGLEYQWAVPGAMLYSGLESSPTLDPAAYSFTGGQFLLYHCTFCDNLDATGTFTGSLTTVPTPEPQSVLLLLVGMLFLLPARVYQRRHRTLTKCGYPV